MANVCWHTGTKANTLMFLKEVEKSSMDVSDLMSEIEQEEDVTDWMVAVLKCRICGQNQTAVMPYKAGLINAECPQCGNMTADVIDDKDKWFNRENKAN